MLIVYNRKKQKVAHLPAGDGNSQVHDVTKTRRLNSDYQLSFLMPMNLENFKELELEGLIECEGQKYVIKDIKRDRKGLGRNALITCKHIMNRLIDIKIPYESAIDESFGADISSLTNIISAATGGVFTFQIMDVFPLKDVNKWGASNCLKAFQDLVNLYEVEFVPDNYAVKLYKKININNGMQYRIKKNIIGDTNETNTNALCTKITGLAKDYLTIINLPASHLTAEELSLLNAVPGAIIGGLIKVPYLISQYAAAWSNPDITYYDSEFEATDIDASDEAGKVLLLEEMRKKLAASEIPDIQISMNAADLWKIDREEVRPQLGETVYLIDPELGINNIQARVMEITEYPFALDKQSQVTVANFLLRDTNDIIADLHASKDLLDGLLTNGNLNTSKFEAYARQAIVDLNNSKTELIYPPEGGILAQDKLNPLKQVRLTSAGLGVSTDGWNTVRAAVTASGVVAEVIVGILGEFAQVKTDNLIAGSVLISSALIQSLKVEKLDSSTAKITTAMIENLVVGSNVQIGSAQDAAGVTSIIGGTVTTSFVNALNVIANSVNAGWVYTNILSAAQVNAVAISADSIVAGILTGRTVRTAVSGRRVQMDSDQAWLDFFNDTVNALKINPLSNMVQINSPGGLPIHIGAGGFSVIPQGAWNFVNAFVTNIPISGVTNLQSSLDGKASISHNHGNTYIKSTALQNLEMQYFSIGNYIEVFESGIFRGRINLV